VGKIKPNFIIALLITITFSGLIYISVWRNAPVYANDSISYFEVMEDLKDGSLDNLHDRTPGYPLLLLITNSRIGKTNRTLFIAQIVGYLTSVFLLSILLNHLGVRNGAIWIFVILSLIPSGIVVTTFILSESLTLSLLVTGVVSLLFWFLLELKRARFLLIIISGFAFGISALVRPTYQLIFFVVSSILIVFYLIDRKNRDFLFAAVTIFSMSLVIIGAFYVNNYLRHGFFGITPLLGFNLSTRTVNVIEELPDEFSNVREILLKYRDEDLVKNQSSHKGYMYIWSALTDLQKLTNLEKPELSFFMLKLNLLLIKQSPLEYLAEVSRSIATYWFPFSPQMSNFNSRNLQLIWSVIHFAVVAALILVLTLLFSIFIIIQNLPVKLRKRLQPEIEQPEIVILAFLIPLTIVLYTMFISSMVDVGNPRHRTPSDLFVFFIIILGFQLLYKFRSQISAIGD